MKQGMFTEIANVPFLLIEELEDNLWICIDVIRFKLLVGIRTDKLQVDIFNNIMNKVTDNSHDIHHKSYNITNYLYLLENIVSVYSTSSILNENLGLLVIDENFINDKTDPLKFILVKLDYDPITLNKAIVKNGKTNKIKIIDKGDELINSLLNDIDGIYLQN
jgi:hypothetical protein